MRTATNLSRARRWLASAMAAIALVLSLLAMVLYGLDTSGVHLGTNRVAGLALGLTYPLVGWLIASRRSDHPIGWIFLVVGLSQGLSSFVGAYATYGLVTAPGSLPMADVAAWVSTVAWSPGFFGLILLVLVFPDGHLPSPGWRPILWLLAIGGLCLVPLAIAEWPHRGAVLLGDSVFDLSRDPLLDALNTVQIVGYGIILVAAILAVGSVLVRVRRAQGVERQQLRWFASAAVAEVAILAITAVLRLPTPFDALVSLVVLPLVPIATAVAILRYRLYDLDRLVSRTVTYGLVTGLLAGAYVVSTLLLSGPFGELTGGGTVAVAVSTLVAAALFQPVRSRVQRLVDRRFDRGRYDADGISAAFGGRLRDQVDLPAVTADLDATVRRALAPGGAVVWLRGAER